MSIFAALACAPIPPVPPSTDPMMVDTCEDPRLLAAGYLVCGSGGDRQWHWQPPGGRWRDNHRTEYAAVRAALRHLGSQR